MGKVYFCKCGNKRNKLSISGLCRKCWLEKKRLDSPYVQGAKVGGGSQYKNGYGQTHYELNRQDYIRKARKRRKENWRKIVEYKDNIPCADCKIRHPWYVNEFDHLPGTKVDRKHEIASLLQRGWSWNNVLKEISKCELVCANCHKIRTFKRSHASIS
jgi:hypothetical protein